MTEGPKPAVIKQTKNKFVQGVLSVDVYSDKMYNNKEYIVFFLTNICGEPCFAVQAKRSKSPGQTIEGKEECIKYLS